MSQFPWIQQFSLFLFDFDGLLVDTEVLHYQAYQRLCSRFGETLPWTFDEYRNIAPISSEKLQQSLREDVPGMFVKEPSWERLYAIKKANYDELLREGQLKFMPGVVELLEELNRIGKPRAIVTHSARPFIEFIADQLPLLMTIPIWVTREDYNNSKPSPDPYLKALEIFEMTADKAVGFEDSPRGFEALQKAKVPAVMINRDPHSSVDKQQIAVFDSFFSIPAEGPFALKGSLS